MFQYVNRYCGDLYPSARCLCVCVWCDAMCPKPSDIQAVFICVYFACTNVCACGLCHMLCSWQRDHFGPWCFCPASKQEMITVAPLESVCMWVQPCVRHYLHLCNYINNTAALRLFSTSTEYEAFFFFSCHQSELHPVSIQLKAPIVLVDWKLSDHLRVTQH